MTFLLSILTKQTTFSKCGLCVQKATLIKYCALCPKATLTKSRIMCVKAALSKCLSKCHVCDTTWHLWHKATFKKCRHKGTFTKCCHSYNNVTLLECCVNYRYCDTYYMLLNLNNNDILTFTKFYLWYTFLVTCG